MTDEPTTEPTPEPDKTGIRAVIADELSKLFNSGKAKVADTPPAKALDQPAGDITGQVEKALKKVRSEETKEERLTSLIADVDALKAASQAPPKQIRKVEKIMGWHRD